MIVYCGEGVHEGATAAHRNVDLTRLRESDATATRRGKAEHAGGQRCVIAGISQLTYHFRASHSFLLVFSPDSIWAVLQEWLD